jgi:Flp pilus assembly protein TadG
MRRLTGKLSGRRFARDERGTQLVELAIVLPVLLMLFGATAEFGRFFYTYQTLAKSTRSAARYITTGATEGTAADTKATNLAVYGNTAGTGEPLVDGLDATHVNITRTGTALAPGHVTVEIDGFRYQPVFDIGKLIGSPSLSLAVDVSPSTTMRFF